MNRSTILILVLSSWVLAACGGSSFSVEEPHHEDDHAEHDDHDDDHDDDHGHDDDDDHGHGHEEEMYTQLEDWLEMRHEFESAPMPDAPDNMMVSAGAPPVTASWSGDIDGTINPSYEDDYHEPEIELNLDEHADMHGNIYVHTDTDERKLVHHLDAENVTGSYFESPEDHDNRMTGTFYGDDHETVVGTVNTAVVIGTYEATQTEDGHEH